MNTRVIDWEYQLEVSSNKQTVLKGVNVNELATSLAALGNDSPFEVGLVPGEENEFVLPKENVLAAVNILSEVGLGNMVKIVAVEEESMPLKYSYPEDFVDFLDAYNKTRSEEESQFSRIMPNAFINHLARSTEFNVHKNALEGRIFLEPKRKVQAELFKATEFPLEQVLNNYTAAYVLNDTYLLETLGRGFGEKKREFGKVALKSVMDTARILT